MEPKRKRKDVRFVLGKAAETISAEMLDGFVRSVLVPVCLQMLDHVTNHQVLHRVVDLLLRSLKRYDKQLRFAQLCAPSGTSTFASAGATTQRESGSTALLVDALTTTTTATTTTSSNAPSATNTTSVTTVVTSSAQTGPGHGVTGGAGAPPEEKAVDAVVVKMNDLRDAMLLDVMKEVDRLCGALLEEDACNPTQAPSASLRANEAVLTAASFSNTSQNSHTSETSQTSPGAADSVTSQKLTTRLHLLALLYEDLPVACGYLMLRSGLLERLLQMTRCFERFVSLRTSPLSTDLTNTAALTDTASTEMHAPPKYAPSITHPY